MKPPLPLPPPLPLVPGLALGLVDSPPVVPPLSNPPLPAPPESLPPLAPGSQVMSSHELQDSLGLGLTDGEVDGVPEGLEDGVLEGVLVGDGVGVGRPPPMTASPMGSGSGKGIAGVPLSVWAI